jgi:hypothetical protein
MSDDGEPPMEGPFTIKLAGKDGKVVHDRVRRRADAIGLVGPVARQPGRRIVAVDRLGREIAEATEPPES